MPNVADAKKVGEIMDSVIERLGGTPATRREYLAGADSGPMLGAVQASIQDLKYAEQLLKRKK